MNTLPKYYTVTMTARSNETRCLSSITLDIPAFNRRDAIRQAGEILAKKFGPNVKTLSSGIEEKK